MNEIEKLYKNVKVKPFRYCYNCVDNNGNRIENSANCPSRHNCSNTCDTPEYEFTAEKQLELIKWLAIKDYGKYTTSLLININSSYVRFSAGLQAGVHCLDVKYDKQSINFENSLAGLVNNLWQDLIEEEKQQIKEILSK